VSPLVAALILFSGSSLDRGVIKPVLHAASPRFKRCYERALKRDQPELEGKARLTFTVQPSGKVSEVEVEFPMVAPEFTQCLREAGLRVRFLKGPAEIKLVWPIVFKRE
jgi:hypothetical protein